MQAQILQAASPCGTPLNSSDYRKRFNRVYSVTSGFLPFEHPRMFRRRRSTPKTRQQLHIQSSVFLGGLVSDAGFSDVPCGILDWFTWLLKLFFWRRWAEFLVNQLINIGCASLRCDLGLSCPGMWDLHPQPGIKSGPSALGAGISPRISREVLKLLVFFFFVCVCF